MGSAAGLIVEFVGLPGAGKSALARQVSVLLTDRGVAVSQSTGQLDRLGVAGRTWFKVGYALQGAMAGPVRGGRWLGRFLEMGQRGLTDTGRVALNWFFLIGLTRRLASRSGVHLLDQGIIQGLWSAGYAARRGVRSDPEVAAALREVLPPRMLVVVVETSPERLVDRLQQRAGGDSRLERDLATSEPGASLARAVAAFASIQELLVLLERQGAVAVLRVRGDQADQLLTTAQVIAERIAGPSPRGD